MFSALHILREPFICVHNVDVIYLKLVILFILCVCVCVCVLNKLQLSFTKQHESVCLHGKLVSRHVVFQNNFGVHPLYMTHLA